MSSLELTEWMAFERACGPLGGYYDSDLLAGIHEKLQDILLLTGAQFEENPAPQPQRIKRPNELYLPEEQEEEDEEDEEQSLFEFMKNFTEG